jgi:hypothetical protein
VFIKAPRAQGKYIKKGPPRGLEGEILGENFKTLTQPLLGEKYVAQKRKKRKKKIITKIVDSSFRCNA